MPSDEPEFLGIPVECHAGSRGEEEPRAFLDGGRRVVVQEIVDRWFGTDHRYFRVQGDDDRVYLLRHDQQLELWEITHVSPPGAIG